MIDASDLEALEAELAREGRWEEVVESLIERAGAAEEPWRRARCFLQAASVYETQLGDLEKAGIMLQAAFAEDFASEEVAAELERVMLMQGRAPDLVAETEGALAGVYDSHQKVALLVQLARWYERFLDDSASAESRFQAALQVDPRSLAAGRGLAEIYARREDWPAAAAQLATVGAAAERPAEGAEFLLAAAELYHRRLNDPTHAAELYGRALEADGDAAPALEGLSEIAWQQKDWARALPLLERMAGAGLRAPADRVRIHQRATQAALLAGNDDKARAHARKVLELDPSPLAFAREWFETAFLRKFWEDVRQTGEWLGSRTDGSVPAADRTDIAVKLGRALVELGEPRRAVARLEAALQVDPGNLPAHEVLVDAHTKLGDVASALQHKKAVAQAAAPDVRFRMLVEIARATRDTLKSPEGALVVFREAAAVRPTERSILHEVLDLYTELKQWKKAVDVLNQLAEGEQGAVRARYRVAAANIMHYELRASDEAVEVYEHVLDDDPSDLKTFERIEKILSAKRAWRDLARAYRRMLKRLGGSPTPEQRPLLLALWRGLADVCRTKLEDLPAAAAALEVCTQLEPESWAEHEQLAQMLEAAGPEEWRRAAERRTLLYEKTSDREVMLRQLHGLRGIYYAAGVYDRVFAVCAALVALESADAKEREFYERLAAGGLPMPQAALTEEIWQKVVYHPSEERRLSLLFSCVAPALALARAQEPRALGLKDKHRLDPGRDPVARLFEFASRVLALPAPVLFVRPDLRADAEYVNVRDQGGLMAALLVSPDIVSGRGEKEVAFVAGRALCLARFEHLALSPHVLRAKGELSLVLQAAVKLCQPQIPVPAEQDEAFQALYSLVQRAVPVHVLEPLSSVMPWVIENLPRIDLDAWRTAADRTADRTGLLLCGDLGAALRVIRQTRGSAPGVALAVNDLVRWSVSESYLGLRELLGMNVAGAGFDPHPPVPEPKVVHRR